MIETKMPRRMDAYNFISWLASRISLRVILLVVSYLWLKACSRYFDLWAIRGLKSPCFIILTQFNIDECKICTFEPRSFHYLRRNSDIFVCQTLILRLYKQYILAKT